MDFQFLNSLSTISNVTFPFKLILNRIDLSETFDSIPLSNKTCCVRGRETEEKEKKMRPFRGGSGIPSGGGAGGGGMLRTVGRVVRAGINNIHEPTNTNFNNSSPTSPTRPNAHKLGNSKRSLSFCSSSTSGSGSQSPFSFPNYNNSFTVSTVAPNWVYGDEFEWEYLEDSEVERSNNGFYEEYLFGPVPSPHEVETALVSLQQVVHPLSYSQFAGDGIPSDLDNGFTSPTAALRRVSSAGSNLDWIEPSLPLYDQRYLQTCGLDRVYDAFHLLQNEPTVQRMVISLSSDKAVWDAILNNETVRELRDSLCEVEEINSNCSNESSNPSSTPGNILRWLFENMKAKFMEVVTGVTQLLSKLSESPDPSKAKDAEAFEDKLKSTFLLTVVVLLVVIVTRANQA